MSVYCGRATLPRNIDPYGYNAKWGSYYDRETGLYLCQHRMYDATAGSWLNRDPIGHAGGVNLFGYCAGGPVGSADPWDWLGVTRFVGSMPFTMK
jgi:RHS repeat-associated protein